MRVARIGSSPLKGGRHTALESVEVSLDGVVGDRVFAVVDLASRKVLKTVENPGLLRCDARWGDGILTIAIDGEPFSAAPQPIGDPIELDYWGRPALVQVVEGPWSAALSAHLGRQVALVRARSSRALVYGAPVTIVTTSSLEELARLSGENVDAQRFRATIVIETADAAPFIEDTWAGRELAIGGATVVVERGIPRCAVIDADPVTGRSGTRLLKTLASVRTDAGAIPFGVYARVAVAGRVARGDAVRQGSVR
jgi:uncharacterized protein YcbX